MTRLLWSSKQTYVTLNSYKKVVVEGGLLPGHQWRLLQHFAEGGPRAVFQTAPLDIYPTLIKYVLTFSSMKKGNI